MIDKQLNAIFNNFRTEIQEVELQSRDEDYSTRDMCKCICDVIDDVMDYLEEQ